MNINISGIAELQNALKNYPANAERVLNEVLHGEGGELISGSIQRLIPVSGRRWKGKKPPARSGNSLTNVDSNLAVTVKSTKAYRYLYFPDDGSNTKRHAGNQQFFYKGAERVQSEIIERCITKLVNEF